MTSDDAHVRFLTVPGARLVLDQGRASDGQTEILLLGNRAGLLSLANVVLWLAAVSWRREMLSLAELPFVGGRGAMRLLIRIEAADATGAHGRSERRSLASSSDGGSPRTTLRPSACRYIVWLR